MFVKYFGYRTFNLYSLLLSRGSTCEDSVLNGTIKIYCTIKRVLLLLSFLRILNTVPSMQWCACTSFFASQSISSAGSSRAFNRCCWGFFHKNDDTGRGWSIDLKKSRDVRPTGEHTMTRPIVGHVFPHSSG